MIITKGLRGLLTNASMVMLGRYSQFVVTLITVPLVARAAGVVEMGLVGVGMAANFFGSIIVDWGLTQILAARRAQGSAGRNTRRAYRRLRSWVLAATLIVSGCIFLLGESPASSAAAIGFAAGAVLSLGDDWVLLGQGLFRTLAVTQLSARGLYLAILPAALWWSPTADAVLLALASCNLVGALATIAACPIVEDNGEYEAAPQLARFGLSIMLSRIVTAAYGISSTAVFAHYVAGHTLGYYSLADRIARAAQSAMDSVYIALIPRFAKRFDETNSAVGNGSPLPVWRLTLTSIIAGGCLAGVIAMASPWVVPILFGIEYGPSVLLVQVQAFILPATAVTSCLSTAILYTVGDRRGIVTASLIGLLVLVVCLTTIVASNRNGLSLSITLLCAEYSVAAWCVCRCVLLERTSLSVRSTRRRTEQDR